MNEQSFAGAKSFARHMLGDYDRLRIRPEVDALSVFSGYAIEIILFREACWQIELIAMLPGANVPKHRHKLCESCDVIVGGSGDVSIGRRKFAPILRGSIANSLLSVPRNVWHGGSPGEQGAAYLSFQKWIGPARLISDDWELWQPDTK